MTEMAWIRFIQKKMNIIHFQQEIREKQIMLNNHSDSDIARAYLDNE